jgi:type VI secretion system ImpM family protein
MSISGSSALCFGKLPSHADFIRFNAASREALALDEWLHHGLYFARTQLGVGWEQDFTHAPTYRFVFNPESADRFLAGVMQPSQDKSQRSYPFLVSLLLDHRWLRDSDAHLAPAAFSSFFEGAGRLIRDATNGLEMREIADQTQALNCPEPDRGAVMGQYNKEFLEPFAVISFWQELFGSFDDPRKFLLFNNLADVLLPVRNRSFRRMNLGLRFPLLKSGQRADYMACFWLNITLTMLGTMPGWPFLFWNTPVNGAPGYLFLFFRQPSPKNFLQLLKPGADTESICAVDEEGKEALGNAAAKIPSALRGLLEKREGSLSGFLKGLIIALS